MTACQFPHVSAMTAYRKGCRCPVCTRQYRADSKRWTKHRAERECFEGCMSQAAVEEWAAGVWASMNSKEQRIVREIMSEGTL